MNFDDVVISAFDVLGYHTDIANEFGSASLFYYLTEEQSNVLRRWKRKYNISDNFMRVLIRNSCLRMIRSKVEYEASYPTWAYNRNLLAEVFKLGSLLSEVPYTIKQEDNKRRFVHSCHTFERGIIYSFCPQFSSPISRTEITLVIAGVQFPVGDLRLWDLRMIE